MVHDHCRLERTMTDKASNVMIIQKSAPVFAAMILSHLGYSASGAAGLAPLATLFGTTYFLSIAIGAVYVYASSYSAGAPLQTRAAASLITPFVWATAGCAALLESHPPLECLYFYLNPLNIWLALFLVLEMGLAEIFCRRAASKKVPDIKILTPGVVAAVVVSFSLVVGLYAWGEGENLYVMFLAGYRHLFGSGVL